MSFKSALPTILSTMAAMGVGVTAALSAKAVPKALKIIEKKSWECYTNAEDPLSKKDIVKLTWKEFIPTIAVGVGTIACIFGSNILNKKQQASLISAYALMSEGYKRYSDKVRELYGNAVHDKIKEDISVEDAKETEILGYDMVPMGDMVFSAEDETEILMYENLSGLPGAGRYFKTTPSRVMVAEMNLNRNFVIGAEPDLNEFYEYLGLEPLKTDGLDGSVIGWDTSGGYYWVDFKHIRQETDDGLIYYVLHTPYTPEILERYCQN